MTGLFGAGKNPLLIAIVRITIARRGFVCSAAPAVMQRGCKGMAPYSNRRGHT